MADEIAAFWAWWATARGELARAFERREGLPPALIDEVSRRVDAIAAGMLWEAGPDGDELTFALVWNGDLARRRIGERWLAAAPRGDARWRFMPARPPGAGWEQLSIVMHDQRLTLGEFVCVYEVDRGRERVDVVLHHPQSATVSAQLHATAGDVVLDRAFGEDGVARWIGDIEFAPRRPRGAVPMTQLVTAVEELARTAGGESYDVLEGDLDGDAFIAIRNAALKPIDHLACDHFAELRMPVGDRMDELEDAFLAAHPGLAYLGHETCRGHRTIFVFAPAGARSAIAAWALAQGAQLVWRADPGWASLRRWAM